VYDDNNETHDWFELYNPGPADISLSGWGITDNKNSIGKWTFPDYMLNAGEYLVVFASGLDISEAAVIDHWESAILPSDLFSYLEPGSSTPANWYTRLSMPVPGLQELLVLVTATVMINHHR
jgi:hypothetical protein